MIIACPVCTTGFNLPTERISAKGVKLRCSKCGHVFRVRLDMANEPEIFYKPGEEPAPQVTKSTQIGFPLDTSDEPDPKTIDLEPHLKGAPDLFADFDAKPDPKPLPDDPFKPDEPQAVDASEEIFNNLTSLSGLSSPDEERLNLFEDASGFGADDPFGGAFDVDEGEFDPFTEFSQAQEVSALGDEEAPMLMAGQPGMAGLKPAAVEPDPYTAPIKEEPKLKNAPKDDDAFWSSGGAGVFGGADDMVDPNFGSTDYFDATAAQPAQPAQPVVAPSPVPKPQAKPATQQERIRLANEPEPRPARAQAPPEDTTSPHKIGGSGAQKAANFVLIVLLVLIGFVGLVGVLNDGMIDFKNFGHMLEVAFSGKPYQPRAEWLSAKSATPKTTATPAAKGDDAKVTAPTTAPTGAALTTHHVTMERVKIGRRSAVLVVRGKVTNNTDKQIAGAKISVRVVNREGNDLAQGEALSGVTLSTKAIKKAKKLEKIQAKLPTAPVAIDAKTAQLFTVVLDSPAENQNDAPVTYKVDVQPAL